MPKHIKQHFILSMAPGVVPNYRGPGWYEPSPGLNGAGELEWLLAVDEALAGAAEAVLEADEDVLDFWRAPQDRPCLLRALPARHPPPTIIDDLTSA